MDSGRKTVHNQCQVGVSELRLVTTARRHGKRRHERPFQNETIEGLMGLCYREVENDSCSQSLHEPVTTH